MTEDRSDEDRDMQMEIDRATTARYLKLPVVISAYQTTVPMSIPTPEGLMQANPGDWIITGVKGETYPCKDDIFRMTYDMEPVVDG